MKRGKRFPRVCRSRLPSVQNNPHAKVTHFGKNYFAHLTLKYLRIYLPVTRTFTYTTTVQLPIARNLRFVRYYSVLQSPYTSFINCSHNALYSSFPRSQFALSCQVFLVSINRNICSVFILLFDLDIFEMVIWYFVFL